MYNNNKNVNSFCKQKANIKAKDRMKFEEKNNTTTPKNGNHPNDLQNHTRNSGRVGESTTQTNPNPYLYIIKVENPATEEKMSEGKNNSSRPETKIPQGKNDSSRPETKIPQGINNSSRPETKIPQGKSDSSRLEAKIPQGKNDSSRLEAKIPQGINDSSRLETKIPQGINDSSRLETKIPQGINDSSRPETKIPQGKSDSSRLEAKIPQGKSNSRRTEAHFPSNKIQIAQSNHAKSKLLWLLRLKQVLRKLNHLHLHAHHPKFEPVDSSQLFANPYHTTAVSGTHRGNTLPYMRHATAIPSIRITFGSILRTLVLLGWERIALRMAAWHILPDTRTTHNHQAPTRFVSHSVYLRGNPYETHPHYCAALLPLPALVVLAQFACSVANSDIPGSHYRIIRLSNPASTHCPGRAPPATAA